MTISEAFETFLRNLEVKNQDDIRLRYRNITKSVNREFRGSDSETENSLYLGSYARNTAINGFSDLDMAVILPEAEKERVESIYTYPQSALLRSVKTALEKTYPRTEMRADGQVVVVLFSDGMQIEVVPFIERSSSRGFYFPDTHDDGSWKETDPKGEQETFFDLSRIANGNAVKIGRIMRAWRRKHNVPISGILLDTFITRFLIENHYGFGSFYMCDWICRDFFRYLSELPKRGAWSSPRHTYMIKEKGDFRPSAREAYNITQEVKSSIEFDFDDCWEWRRIFGDDFPLT